MLSHTPGNARQDGNLQPSAGNSPWFASRLSTAGLDPVSVLEPGSGLLLPSFLIDRPVMVGGSAISCYGSGSRKHCKLFCGGTKGGTGRSDHRRTSDRPDQRVVRFPCHRRIRVPPLPREYSIPTIKHSRQRRAAHISRTQVDARYHDARYHMGARAANMRLRRLHRAPRCSSPAVALMSGPYRRTGPSSRRVARLSAPPCSPRWRWRRVWSAPMDGACKALPRPQREDCAPHRPASGLYTFLATVAQKSVA
jgi:hypothetical protein